MQYNQQFSLTLAVFDTLTKFYIVLNELALLQWVKQILRRLARVNTLPVQLANRASCWIILEIPTLFDEA